MYKENKSFLGSIISAACSLALAAVPFFFTATEDANAGELYRSQQTLRKQTGLGKRTINKSTKASRFLQGARSSKTLDFNQSSPYEARMVNYNTAMRKYEKDYAKWEYKTEQLQAKQDKKAEKERAKDLAKKKKEQEKIAKITAREQEKQERRNKRAEKGGATSFLARAFGGKEAPKEENKVVVQDEKAKKAEAFFGSIDSDTSATAPVAVDTNTKPKLSFWQRLKRALFGGK